MNEQLVTYKTAKLAKEKGFDEETRDYFQIVDELDGVLTKYIPTGVSHDILPDTIENFCILRPTQVQLQTWLRNKYKIHVAADAIFPIGHETVSYYAVKYKSYHINNERYDSWEIALEEAIIEKHSYKNRNVSSYYTLSEEGWKNLGNEIFFEDEITYL